MESIATSEKKKRRRGAKNREQVPVKDLFSDVIHASRGTPLVGSTSNTIISQSNKKKRKKGPPPKPGEPGYMSASQLRNARKRRAKQQSKVLSDPNLDKIKKFQKKRAKNYDYDPSTRYLNDPLSCPLIEKAKNYFYKMNKEFRLHLGDLSGWRTVSKLPVRRVDGKCTIGLFRPNSHNIVSVPDCQAHHSSINEAMKMLQNLCDKLLIDPYDETSGSGYFRYVCLNIERVTGKVQLTIVWNSAPYKDIDDIEGKKQLDKLSKSIVEQKEYIKLHSLWIHFNSQWKHADNIFDFGSACGDSLWSLVHGPHHVVERLDLSCCKFAPIFSPVDLHFPPNVFRQANLDAFSKIVVAIRDYVASYNTKNFEDSLPTCVELYGGVGTIGLNMIDLFKNFVSSDENPHNKFCFEKSVGLLKDHKSKCKYIPKNATDVIKQEKILDKNCDIIIVDPPRKGLDEFVCHAISEKDGPQLLVYVSCGFDAFIRDCDYLLKSDCWILDHAEGHVLFPGSDALETLAFFRRK